MAQGKGKWIWRAVVVGLVGAAVVQELRKPQEERAWHGKVAGVISYELRRPTFQRARETYWAPEDEHLLKPTLFGVGWALNVGRAVRMIRGNGQPVAA